MNQYRKLFLSHSQKDKPYGDAVVSLLMKVGLGAENILYSSEPSCGIPIGQNIYDYLRQTIEDGAYMIYLLSDNYYESISCLNEMGAAWMRQNDFLLLATPAFDYKKDKFQKGAANPRSLAISMDNRVRMEQFVGHIKEVFKTKVDNIRIQSALNEYFQTLDAIIKSQKETSPSTVGLENIVKEKPREELEFIALGKALWDKDKNYTAAIQQYLYAIFLNENCETAYVRIIEAAVGAKEYSDGWKICAEAVKRFPESPRILGSRGYLECAEHKYEEAILDCSKAMEKKKDRWYSNTRGRAFWGINKRYEALMDFHESYRLDPQYTPAIQNIKKLCKQLGADQMIDEALQKKQEGDCESCQAYLQCVLIADENNIRARWELEKVKSERASSDH